MFRSRLAKATGAALFAVLLLVAPAHATPGPPPAEPDVDGRQEHAHDVGEEAPVGGEPHGDLDGEPHEDPGGEPDGGEDGEPDPNVDVLLDPGPDAQPVPAQVEHHSVSTETDGHSAVLQTGGLRVVGATWDEALGHLHVHVRSHDGEEWSSWQELHVEELDGPDPTDVAGTEPVALTGERIEVRVQTHDDQDVDVDVAVIDPGGGAAVPTASTMGSPVGHTGPPQINSRAAWGADETIRTWRPQAGRVTGAVVHHTAGTNNYTRAQVPALIRGIYTYHALTRGWGDIGYNVLVDRFGQAWEGRYGGVQNPVIGAHASGSNDTMFGISVMGDFSTTEVPPAAFHQTARVIGWKFSRHGITTAGHATGPNGRTVDRIVGHGDVGNTQCPGARFHARLGELRGLVDDYQEQDPPRSTPGYREVRLAGADRFGTAVQAARWSYPRPETVFVATATDYADALGAGPGAVSADAPVLLVYPDRIPDAVVEELERIDPDEIQVLGGTAAVSDTVLSQLRQHGQVRRIVGQDRYQTAGNLAAAHFDAAQATEVWISSGEEFPDALSGGAAAAHRDAPMLLTRSSGLPGHTERELRRIAPDRVVLVGGSSAISGAVQTQVQALLPGSQVQRLGGTDRYQTSAAVADEVWSTNSRVFYATGLDWPDALSGVAAAGRVGAPMLLLRGDCAPAATRSQTAVVDPDVAFLLGGTEALADSALTRNC